MLKRRNLSKDWKNMKKINNFFLFEKTCRADWSKFYKVKNLKNPKPKNFNFYSKTSERKQTQIEVADTKNLKQTFAKLLKRFFYVHNEVAQANADAITPRLLKFLKIHSNIPLVDFPNNIFDIFIFHDSPINGKTSRGSDRVRFSFLLRLTCKVSISISCLVVLQLFSRSRMKKSIC